MKKIGFFIAALIGLVWWQMSENVSPADEFSENTYRTESFYLDKDYDIPQSEVTIFRHGGVFGVRNARGETLLSPVYSQVLYTRKSDYGYEEYSFWKKCGAGTVRSCLPDARVVVDRYNLVVYRDSLCGLYSRAGEQLLPVKYTEINLLEAPVSYEVVLAGGDSLGIWKDGRFIIREASQGYCGVDLQKKRYVFGSDRGKNWAFYDFTGEDCQQLTLEEIPGSYYIPQYLEPGRFLVPDDGDSRVVNSNGRRILKVSDVIEVCGNFLLASSQGEEGFYDVLFNDGKTLTAAADMAYAVVSSSIPHLPTGEIVIEKDHGFRLYDAYGKFIKEVSGVYPVWLLWEERAELGDKVLVYAETD